MSDLPRLPRLPQRPIEPLPPTAGSFDAVVGRARYRRQRRVATATGVVVVFFAGIAGGASLDGGVSRVGDTIAALSTLNQDGPSPPAPEANTSAIVTPEVDRTPRPEPTPGADAGGRADAGAGAGEKSRDLAVAMTAPVARVVTGVAVDAAGGPVAGLYVYPGQQKAERFLATASPATRTAKDGSFSLPCTGTPVLLSPWPVNAPWTSLMTAAVWSPTFVGGGTDAAGAADAPCSTDGSVLRTTVLTGSTVNGTVTMPEDCADAELPLWIWLHNDRSLTVRLPDLSSGSAYSVGGLPPGQHTIGANGNRTTVTVGGGETWTEDVTFGCGTASPPEMPEPSSTPSPSQSPLPTSSTTVPPVPTTTPSEPEPDPSTAPSPTPTPTPTPTGSVGARP